MFCHRFISCKSIPALSMSCVYELVGRQREGKEEAMTDMVDINEKYKENSSNEKIIQEMEARFIEHKHFMALR